MRFKARYVNLGVLLLVFLFCMNKCKGYILNINVVDKDDLFIFLYKNEHLLAASYYNFKPSYFFSVEEGEINIDMTIDFRENKLVKKKNKNQEILAKANKNSINILNNFNVDREYFHKKGVTTSEGDTKESPTLTNETSSSESHTNEYIQNEGSTGRSNYKSNNLFLVLITADQWLNYIRMKNKLEPSLKNEENYIFTSHFNCIKRYPLEEGTIKKKIQITQKNRYMLFLINNNKLKIDLKGNIIFYDYRTKHLSHDFQFIPNVLYLTTYILLVLVVILTLYFIKYREKTDIFMILNMFFFLLSTYFNYKNVNFIREWGYMYLYFWVSANIFKKIQEIISFIIYLQVSLGDMYIRSHLSRIEIQFMICFSVISFYTGIFEIFLGNFQAPRYILQAFAYLFIFIAINFTSTFLSARLSEENLSFHVAELYKKYDIYKKYRVIFFAVILKPILLIVYKVLCLSPSNIDLYSSHEFLYVFFDITFDIVLYVITHLYHLRQTSTANTLLTPLMYKLHFHFLKLRRTLKYLGKCVIYYASSLGRRKRIQVYADTDHLRILHLALISSCGKAIQIEKIEVKKKKKNFYIHLKERTKIGVYKLVIFFYYQNGEEKTEGIYATSNRKLVRKKKKCWVTAASGGKDPTVEGHKEKGFYFVLPNDEAKIFHFHFKKVKFECRRRYTYINTFCEYFYLPLVFPCLVYNNHKAKFRLKVSFEIELIGGSAVESRWGEPPIRTGVNFSFTNDKHNDKKAPTGRNTPVRVVSPSHLVVTNSRLKRVYYSQEGGGLYSSLWKHLQGGAKRLCRIASQWRSTGTLRATLSMSNAAKKKHRLHSPSGGGHAKTRWELYQLSKRRKKLATTPTAGTKLITYQFCETSKIATYTFCLFAGLYKKLELKVKSISVFIYMEKGGPTQSSHGKSRQDFFVHVVKETLMMYLKIHVFRAKLEESKFIQFMIVNTYKYAGEENHNCITLLISLVEGSTPCREDRNNVKVDFYQKVSLVKLIVHEIFHSLWGNCLYFKKAKYLWLKEGLSRYYELRLCEFVLSKFSKFACCRWKLTLWFTLEYHFYVLLVDTLNVYNHALDFATGGKRKCREEMYAKDIHHFYNALTYNKGMNLFKIISVITRPYFSLIMNLLFYTFYNRSINFRKFFKFFHFFFRLFHVKPFFLNRNGYEKCARAVKALIRRKRKFSYRQHDRVVGGALRSTLRRGRVQRDKAEQCASQETVCGAFFTHLLSSFLKRPFKKRFQAYCIEEAINHGSRPIRSSKWKRACGVRIYNRGRKNRREKITSWGSVQSPTFRKIPQKAVSSKTEATSKKRSYPLEEIVQTYIKAVGPPKIFLKFFKNKNKLLITQKHFYYDNYEQTFKETHVLFHVPLIFTVGRKVYKVLLTRRYALIDVLRENEKDLCETKTNQLNDDQKTFTMNSRNVSYFSFHFVDIFSFEFILNSIKHNLCRKADIIHVITNVFLGLLVRLNSLKQVRHLNSLISRQVFLLYKLFKETRHTKGEVHTVGMILCEEFFKCYAHFSSHFTKIEDRKLKIEINRELRSCEEFNYLRDEVEFVFKDFRNYLSKIFFFYKESISELL
ncbi:hypothetical protein AK88_00427 [Plasmodium fragile]|uniref:Peptidase M1 membrane alanine aminopeptidase domain-containing protein n=1 Tax=Plasmodium fragile TaxID=5857 RepID=A0A0D9QU86_PLAFR|nr:uncharacterized protein AK88_00427 [Plasmodium fragile]KJP89971.1 hypothetical protein AK88_00427 [Plasmodium fragile]